jgi:hypothetical protein
VPDARGFQLKNLYPYVVVLWRTDTDIRSHLVARGRGATRYEKRDQ